MNSAGDEQLLPDSPPPPDFPSRAVSRSDENMWAMFVHFSLLAGLVVPYAGLILPIILWQVKKGDLPSIDAHGKIVVNWIISAVIYSIVCCILIFILIGILGLFAIWIMTIVFSVIGGIKANNGEVWAYPCSLKLVK